MKPTKHDVSWVAPLMGKRWVSGARGPEEYDCWGLLRHVFKNHVGISLPSCDEVDAANIPLVTKEISKAIYGGHFIQIDKPIHLCAVGLSKNSAIHHVGIWLDVDGGVILHSNQGSNVTVQNIRSMRVSGFNTILFYRHKDQFLP